MMEKRLLYRMILVPLVLAFALPLLAGCASEPQPTSAGYVESGPNAKPAKKGENNGAEKL